VLLGCSGSVICVICRSLEEIPWAETGAEVIVESIGVFFLISEEFSFLISQSIGVLAGKKRATAHLKVCHRYILLLPLLTFAMIVCCIDDIL